MVGDWLSYVAVSLLALSAGEGAWALAIVFAAHLLPTALVSPWAGTLADRMDRRTVLVGTQVVMALLMVGMIVAAMERNLLAVEILLFARTAVGGFFYPAKQAAMRELVESEELVEANAIDTATWSLAFTFGTALGGLFAVAGPVLALSVDAATFVLAAIVFTRLPPLPAKVSDSPSRRPASVRFLARAFRNAKESPALFEAMLSKAPMGIAGGAAWLGLNFRAEELASSGVLVASTAIAIGTLQAIRGVGTGIGPVLAKRFITSGFEARRLLRISSWISLASIASFALVESWPLTLLSVFGWGVGSGGYWVFSSAELQRRAPENMMGRLAAIDQLAMNLGMSLAAMVGALAVSLFATTQAAAWAGVVMGVVAYMALRLYVGFAARGGAEAPCLPSEA